MPHPVAAVCAQGDRAIGAEHRSVRDMAWSILRTLAAMLLPDYLRGPRDPAVEADLAALTGEHPTTAWARLVASLQRNLAERRTPPPFAPELGPWLGDDPNGCLRRLERLLGTADGDDLEAISDQLVDLLHRLDSLAGYRLVTPLTQEPTRRRTFVGRLRILTGEHEAGDSVDAEWDAFLLPDTVYLLAPDGRSLLEVTPFVEWIGDGDERPRPYLFAGISQDARRWVQICPANGAIRERGVLRDGRELDVPVWLELRDQLQPFQVNVDHRGTLEARSPIVELRTGDLAADRYEIRAVLGSGGMSTVYRAWDRRVEEELALKVLKAELAADPGLGQRFRREAEVMTRLSHPHVCRARHVGELADGRQFVTMNIFEGGSLADHLASDGVEIGQVRTWAEQALQALVYLHDQGLVHRDVKPSNLLLDERGRLVLADFGIALRAGDSDRLTRTLQRVGSVAYMAPEQARVRDVSAKADIYSLARVLHDLLAGEHKDQSPGRGLRGPFGKLIRQMAALDPEERPSAAEALLQLHAPAAREVATAVEAIAIPTTHSGRLERLERAAQDLTHLVAAAPIDLDGVIDCVSALAAEGTELGNVLRQAAAPRAGAEADADDPNVYPLAVSLSHLGHQVDVSLRNLELDDDGRAALAGLLLQIHDRMVGPADALLHQGARGDEVDIELFERFEDPSAGHSVGRPQDWLLDLESADELRAYDAALATVSPGQEAFLADLQERPATERERLLSALWDRADVLILRGLGRSRVVFETAVELATGDDLRNRWKHLFALYRRGRDGFWAPSLIRLMLDKYPPQHRRVFGRALLFHPSPAYRTLARDILEPADFWQVISHRRTPVSWLLDLWRHLRTTVSPHYLKIFFVCVRDNLVRGGNAQRMLAVVELMKEFYTVDAFHEDTYFDLLLGMDEPVRTEARRLGLVVDFDTDYVRLFRSFLKSGKAHADALEGWGQVPLPVQRRLARRGHFLNYFTCHPVDRIALETLRFLTARENVTDFVKVPSINSRLLAELAKEKRLFRRDDARMALVANPKTPANVIMQHIQLLQAHHLRELSRSREANQVARTYAQRMLRKHQ